MGKCIYQGSRVYEIYRRKSVSRQKFDYEDVCMGVSDGKPETYYKSFVDDYRLRSLTQSIHSETGKILDIGCGGGRIAETLPYYYPKASIYGCDISSSAITYAKKYGSRKVAYAHMKSKRLPYRDNFFDVCICLDVLEHIPDTNYFLNEVKRILKKNGKFFVIVPCEGEPFTYTWWFQKIGIGQNLTLRYFGHIHPEFTHSYVIALLRKHGFSIHSVRYSEHIFYQLLHVCLFYGPKLLLEKILGKKMAHEYDTSSLIHSPKKKIVLLMMVRNMWFRFFEFMMNYPMSWETIICSNIPFGAWKLHFVATQ